MTKVWNDWLPPSALTDGRIAEALELTVSAWSARWFRNASYALGKPVLRMAKDRLVAPKSGLTKFGTVFFVDADPELKSALALSALDAPEARPESAEVDRRLIENLASEILEDLGSSCSSVLGQHSADGGASPFDLNGGIEFLLSSANGAAPQLKIGLPSAAIVPLRKSFIKSVPRQPKDSGPMSAAVANSDLGCKVILGEAHLTVAQLSGLEIGDVLVLDSDLQKPVSLCSAKSAERFFGINISQQDGALWLVAAP